MNKSFFRRLKEYMLPLLLCAYAGSIGRILLLATEHGKYVYKIYNALPHQQLEYLAPLILMIAIAGYFPVTALMRRGKIRSAKVVRCLLTVIFAVLHMPVMRDLANWVYRSLGVRKMLRLSKADDYIRGGSIFLFLILMGVVLLVIRFLRLRKGISADEDSLKRRYRFVAGLGTTIAAAGLTNLIIRSGNMVFIQYFTFVVRNVAWSMVVIGLFLLLLPRLAGLVRRLEIPEKAMYWLGWAPATFCIVVGLAVYLPVFLPYNLGKNAAMLLTFFTLLFHVLYILCVVAPFIRAMHKLDCQINEAARREIDMPVEKAGKAEKICAIVVLVFCLIVIFEVVCYKWVMPHVRLISRSELLSFLSESWIRWPGSTYSLLNIPAYFAIVRSPYGMGYTPAISNGICALMLIGTIVAPILCIRISRGVHVLSCAFAAIGRGILKVLNAIAYFAGCVYGTMKMIFARKGSAHADKKNAKIPQWLWLVLIGIVLVLLVLNLGVSLVGKILPDNGNSGSIGILRIFIDDDDPEPDPKPIKRKDCTYCDGSGECDKCSGSGECEKCDGEGGIWCDRCFGSGTCGECDGMGGEWYNPVGGSSRWLECTHCDGKKRCNYCNGGEDPCYMCNSTGDCFACKGTGDCSYCD